MDDIIDINTLFGPMPVTSADLPVETLLELMQKHSIGSACVLSTLGILLDPGVGNSVTRATCAENDNLRPVATLNPMAYFGDAEPFLRLPQEGFCLLRFFPATQGWPVDFAPFRALLRRLDETRLPSMIEIGAPGQITTLARELEEHTLPVILEGVASETLAEAVAVLRHRNNWYLETSRLLAPGNIKMVVDTVGPERLLFGSRAPSYPVAGVLKTLQYAGLQSDVLQIILHANARRILHLGQHVGERN
jgi:predicted TIM-barrel fold metal-dependent hydrolase